MADRDHIRNPVEWSLDQLRTAGAAVEHTGQAVRGIEAPSDAAAPAIRRIEVGDLREVLAKGWQDFAACRSDVIFLCVFYPLAGFVLAWSVFNYDVIPLLFPLVSGFALLGPVAAVGLYEMSRRREQGAAVRWGDAFGVLATPQFGAILVLGIILLAIFLLWIVTAHTIYLATMGQEGIASLGAFYRDIFSTAAGRDLIVVGIGVGFLFAVLVLAISVVSFPMLLDRNTGLWTAITTSLRVCAANPVPMAVWGLIVAGGLVLGSLPLLLGLIVVIPVLGHATWHLYRRVVA